MPRYICEPLRSDGTPRHGTIGMMVREYANDRNALRYFPVHLREDHFLPGQYRVSLFVPHDHRQDREVGTLYKKADTPAST